MSDAERFLGGGPFTVEPVDHTPVAGATKQLYRVRAADGRSAVVKVLHQGANRRWPAAASSASPWWWRREASAYASNGLRERLAEAGLRMPRLLGQTDRDPQIDPRTDLETTVCALWLEDLTGTPGPTWDVERIARAAASFGRLAALEPIDEPWLSRGWLRSYTRLRDDDAAAFAKPWGDLEHLRGPAERLWAERDRWLAVLDTLPRSLAHLDLWPGNLFDDEGATVVTDFAYTGIAAIGEDLGNLVPDSIADLWQPVALIEQLDTATWDAFAGALPPSVDPRLARLGLCASTAVKFAWFALRLAGVDDREAWGAFNGATYPVQREAFLASIELVQARADEARRLAP